MITDKEKYAALLYFHVKESKKAVAATVGKNAYKVLSGERFPSVADEKTAMRLFPEMRGMLDRSKRRRGALTPRSNEEFDKLFASGNARLRGRDGQDVPLTNAKVAVVGVGSSMGLGLRMAALVFKTPNGAEWIAMLEEAEKSKTGLTELVTGLRQLNKEISDGVR